LKFPGEPFPNTGEQRFVFPAKNRGNDNNGCVSLLEATAMPR